jgi:hypothetical protein
MEAVRVLTEEIGPRPACSGAESRAARWCGAHLADAGLEVEIESFDSRPDAHPWIAGYLAASGVAALVMVLSPLAGFVIGTFALVLYARDVDGRPLIGGRSQRSVNVVARRGGAAPELVVVSQLDSPRRTSFSASLGRPGLVAVQGLLVATPALAAGAWVAEAGDFSARRLASVAALAFVVTAIAALSWRRATRAPFSAGANDCASGVEVVMRLAHRFDDDRIWWLFVGSGHAGQLGMHAFLEAHAVALGGARVLNLLPVGAGSVSAAFDEGAMRVRRADGALLDAAAEAGAGSCSYRIEQSAAAVAIAHHRRALSLVGTTDGSGPRHGPLGETVEDVEPRSVDAAEDLAARVIAVTTGATDRGPARRGWIGGGAPS